MNTQELLEVLTAQKYIREETERLCALIPSNAHLKQETVNTDICEATKGLYNNVIAVKNKIVSLQGIYEGLNVLLVDPDVDMSDE